MSQKDVVEQIKRTAKKPVEEVEDSPREFKAEDLVPSGSTLLNCACSDTPWGAFRLGTIATIPGTSQGGKTMLVLTALAEARALERLNHYELYYDDVEEALEIDVNYMFGRDLFENMAAPPLGTSNTIQQFKANILNLSKNERSFIYVLDSFDALTSDEELEKEMKKALAMAKSEEAAKAIAGSFGMEKAKIAGQILRMIKGELAKTNSLLLILQQLRQNTDRKTPFSPKYVVSGGEAPYFYSTHQCWLTKAENIKDKGQRIGAIANVSVKKNKLTGKYREISFPIYNDYGIDDLASCIDFMVDVGPWIKEGTKIKATELDLVLPKSKLIEEIEEKGLERRLRKAVGAAWKKNEEDLKLKRKPKYSRV
jgi:RecA/RadA recombinase